MMSAARLGVTEYTTPSDTQVMIRRLVNAPRPIAFEAWTSPRHMPTWLSGPAGQMTVCQPATAAGERWTLTWRLRDGGEMTMTGVCREYTPPVRVVQTEKWGPEWPETVNTLEFAEHGDQTMITLTIAYESKAARDAALQTGMKSGMENSFGNFDQLLDTLR